MEIPGALSGIFRAPPASASAGGQWQTGQLLQATVLGSDIGRVLLAIGNRQVTAETSLALQKDQRLTLLVRSLGEQPVLKILSLQPESGLAVAIRALLPRQAGPSPALASLVQLLRKPGSDIPSPVIEQARNLVRQLPDPASVSTSPGLKQALAESGLFLEQRLMRTAGQAVTPETFRSDFKANLLRLVQVVRNWPGTRPGDGPAGRTGTAAGSPAAPTPADADSRAAPTRPGTPSPEALRQLVRNANGLIPAARATVTTTSETRTPATPVTSTTAAAAAPGAAAAGKTSLANGITPPPFRGTVPLPQPPVATALEWLDQASVRTDFLRQIEAALSRLQMQQLAAIPREGERGLFEWLLDLPVRRGEDLDLWSMRWYREPDSERQDPAQQAGWSVQLAFDLPGLGPMQAVVQLRGEQVTTRFWAQQPDTLPLLRANLDDLRQSLQASGLEVGDLDCHAGNIPAREARPEQPFIREKA